MKIDSFDGQYAFLSNFYDSPITYEGINYPTVEHAFQAAKSMDSSVRKTIANMDTPGKAKRAGRKVELRSDWETVKFDVMKELVTLKFQIPELREKLKATGDAELIEGNTRKDTCWGVCNGKGADNLGKILMEVRKTI